MSRLWPKSARLPRPLEADARARERGVERFRGVRGRPLDLARRGAARGAQRPSSRWPRAVVRSAGRRSRRLFERCEGADPLEALLFLDRHTYLAEGVLAKVDRMSMAHGLEVRSPLLDHEVVELSLRIAAADKIRGGTGKRILRRLAAKLLPPEVVHGQEDAASRRPCARGSADPSGRSSSGRLLAPDAFVATVIREPVLRRMVAEHESGARDLGQKIWRLLALEAVGVAARGRLVTAEAPAAVEALAPRVLGACSCARARRSALPGIFGQGFPECFYPDETNAIQRALRVRRREDGGPRLVQQARARVLPLVRGVRRLLRRRAGRGHVRHRPSSSAVWAFEQRRPVPRCSDGCVSTLFGVGTVWMTYLLGKAHSRDRALGTRSPRSRSRSRTRTSSRANG